jgi:hypothetical protein
MPPDALHKKKLKKNLAVCGLVLLWVALIWAVTMIRLAHPAHSAELDSSKAFAAQRAAFLEKSQKPERDWQLAYGHHAPVRARNESVRDRNRELHMQYSQRAEEVWFRKWKVKAPLRRLFDKVDDRARAAFLGRTEAKPEEWWNNFLSGTPQSGGFASSGGAASGPVAGAPGSTSVSFQPTAGNGRTLGITTTFTPQPIENSGSAPANMFVAPGGGGPMGSTLRMTTESQPVGPVPADGQ